MNQFIKRIRPARHPFLDTFHSHIVNKEATSRKPYQHLFLVFAFSGPITYFMQTGGSNSVVECQLPKLNVAGSIPVSRSISALLPALPHMMR